MQVMSHENLNYLLAWCGAEVDERSYFHASLAIRVRFPNLAPALDLHQRNVLRRISFK